jgi:hypothetical protein
MAAPLLAPTSASKPKKADWVSNHHCNPAEINSLLRDGQSERNRAKDILALRRQEQP